MFLNLIVRQLVERRPPDYRLEIAAQKFFHYSKAFLVIERRSAMSSAVNDLQLNRSFRFPVCAPKLERLIDGHLRILIAVQQEKRRIMRIHVKGGTREPGERGNVVRLAAQQEVQRRHANLQAVWR